MEITKKQIADLEVGQSVSSPIGSDRNYPQRVRNYAHQLKKDGHIYTVRKRDGKITVTRLKEPAGLTAKLRAMSPGDVCYPCDAKHAPFLSATVNALGGREAYKITNVMRVERIK